MYSCECVGGVVAIDSGVVVVVVVMVCIGCGYIVMFVDRVCVSVVVVSIVVVCIVGERVVFTSGVLYVLSLLSLVLLRIVQ